jgi:endonuclease I
MKTSRANLLRIVLISIILCFMWASLLATLIVNENIQNWTAHSSYGNYTQQIGVGTITLTRCLVSPGAAANGAGSGGRVQFEANTGKLEFPQLSSVGDVEFVFSAGSAGRSVWLQQLVGSNWSNITQFSNISSTGSRFYYRLGIGSSTTLRLSSPSHAIYLHDMLITDYDANPLAVIETPVFSNLTYSSADVYAVISSAGASAISQRGFCWSTQASPDTSDVYQLVSNGISPMAYTISDLNPSTTYYVRAFAINSSGISYSDEGSFSTIGIGHPTVQTSGLTFYPGSTSVQVSFTPGNGSRRLVKINTANSFTPPADGVEYIPNPVYNGSSEQVVYCGATQIIEGEPINTFAVSGLQRNTNYWFAAYEMNGSGETAMYNVQFALGNPAATTTLNASIEGYYNSAIGYGYTLKNSLHNIISQSHLTQFAYDALWQQLQYTDEDSLNTNNIIQTYSGWSIPKNYYGTGSTQWNREHTWSVSHGGFSTSRPAGTDLHHVRPCDVTVNSAKGNKDFDEGGSPYVDSSPYPGYDGLTGCNTSTDFWEPRDVEKGDVARMLMYMALRYEGTDTAYDLELQDTTPTGGPFYGKLSTLLEWHYQDPPDAWERRRNNRIQERQGNRNPFIDHPEFATRLWVPLALAGTSEEPGQLTVNWQSCLNAQEYSIDISTDAVFNNMLIQNFVADSNQTSQTFELPGIDVVFYRIRAYFGEGYSRYSNIVTVYTGTLPVELSSFSVSIIEQRNVRIQWTTESETNLSGFIVYRADSDEYSEAIAVSALIEATNTSSHQAYVFTDAELPEQGGIYYYWIKAISMVGYGTWHGPQMIYVPPASAVDDELSPNAFVNNVYPNPFGEAVNIEFVLKQGAELSLKVYNLKGQMVYSHVSNQTAGTKTIAWDGYDSSGKRCPVGLYFARIEYAKRQQTIKLLRM